MTDWSIYEIAGIAGVAVYLGSYAALQLGKLHGQGYAYAGLNTLAASLVLVSLIKSFNLSSAMIQVSWITISVVGIGRHYILTHMSRFSNEEHAFLKAVLPELDKVRARKLLDLGFWVSGETNTVLTELDIPVPYLIYIESGGADVYIKGTVVAAADRGALIGEITAPSGEPATATVVLNQPSRYLSIPVRKLRSLMAKDPVLQAQLEKCLSKEVRRKLIHQTNLRHFGQKSGDSRQIA